MPTTDLVRIKKRRPRVHSTHVLDGMYEHDKRNVEIWFDKHWNDDEWREALIERVRNPESIIV